MNELNLSAGKGSEINISGNAPYKHSSLGGLDFESSGHTGFQQELTDEQLKQIKAVSGKEDKSNKVATLNEEASDLQYPTAKAVLDGIKNLTGWELIKSDTLTSQINILSWADLPKLKEIYLYFKIPTINPDNASDFPKARIMLYNSDKVDVTKCIFYEQSPSFGDTGATRVAVYHIQMFGKRCDVYRKGTISTSHSDLGYNLTPTSVMSISFGKELDNPYIDKLTAYMLPTGTRYFPVDTEFEIWGVRA